MKIKKHVSTLLTVAMFISILPNIIITARSATYDADAAITYATNHWQSNANNDCANFVSKCLQAGGINISQSGCPGLHSALQNYGSDFVLTAKGSNPFNVSQNSGKISKGDPIFVHCLTCAGKTGEWPHVYICGGIYSSGNIFVYSHSPSYSPESNQYKGQLYNSFTNSAHKGHSIEHVALHISAHTHSYTQDYEASHPHQYYMRCSCGDWYYTNQNAAVMNTTYESAHPHKYYIKCSLCDYFEYTGETKYVSSCVDCNRPAVPTVQVNTGTSLSETVISWSASNLATHYEVYIDYADGTRYFSDWHYTGTSYSVTLPAGNYKAYVVAVNGNLSNCYQYSQSVSFTVNANYYFDLNASVDGEYIAYSHNAGTADIYINDTLVSSGVSDFYQPYPAGTRFEVKNITPSTGYYFAGSNIPTAGTISGETVSLMLIFNSCQSTLTVDPNGGVWNGSEETQVFTQKHDTTLSVPAPTRVGYSFDGWDFSGNHGTMSSLNQDAVYTFGLENGAEDTLCARWTGNTYTVTFNPGSRTCGTETKTVTFGEVYGDLPTADRTGYHFNGWRLDGANITEDTVVSTANDHTLSASWQANCYMVTFDPNGGECETESKWATYNTTYGTLPVPTRNGFAFQGWYTENGSRIAENTVMRTAMPHTLYAHWAVNTCTVSFDSNGGICDTETKTVNMATLTAHSRFR